VTGAVAGAFAHVLFDPAWHKRYLRATAQVASDAARISALRALSELRRQCALLGYELALYDRGPVRNLAEHYEDRLSVALQVRVPRGFYLREPGRHLDVASALGAWPLEVRLHEVLTGRFNEDFWRNPASGRWLSEGFSKGLSDRGLFGGASAAETTLLHAARRLVAVLNR
jgi:hypothetical protein